MIALRLFVLAFALIVFAAPVMAEDTAPEEGKAPEAAAAEEKPAEEAKEAETSSGRKAPSESAKKMYKSISKFAMNLDPPEMQHFYLTYNNYNLLKTVETVRGDVGKAVDACAKNNPDMADKLQSRYQKWSEALEPVYKESEGNLNNMIIAQEYAKPEQIQDIFKQVDETRDEAQSQFEKIPVTTPEACDYMLGKMDETEESMLSLLRATLISYPQSIPGFVPPADGEKAPEAPEAEDKKG
jgi:hypothetical protein